MKVGKYIMILMMTGAITLNGINARAAETNKETNEEIQVERIKGRVDEIKAMDFSHMTRQERMSVKHELKDMNKELRVTQPYIFISAGALIVIILLLILLV